MRIKKYKGLVFCCGIALGQVASSGYGADAGALARTSLLVNNGWMFHKADQAGAEGLNFDDSGWEHVNLPHSVSIPYWDGMVAVYEGDAWYRKEFTAEKSLQKRCAFVEFESAFQYAWVYLNGKLLGEHKGGYTGFSYCMNPALIYGGRNVLAVRVRNGWDAKIAPRAGDSIFPNRIGNVRFVVANPQHVDWCGQYITTPQVSEQSASVRVQTRIKNEASDTAPCTVAVEVVDAGGYVVTQAKSEVSLAPGTVAIVMQDLPSIATPELWSPEHAYLYQVRTRLYNDRGLLDDYQQTIGIRRFKFTADDGFFLNGKHLYLHGFNMHEDRAGWGFAVADADMYRDLSVLKKAGANCIRASHNPHPPAFYRACDELGLMVWDELHFWGRGGFKGGQDGSYMAEAYPPAAGDRQEFDKTLKSNFSDMIRENRNHPSIIVWGLGNETVMQMQEPLLSETGRMLRELNDLAHQLDPTRPTGMGNELDVADIVGFNGGFPETKLGNKPILTTEYMFRREPDRDPWRSGALAWIGFDYGRHCTTNSWGRRPDFGMYDYHRLLKKEFIDLLPYEFRAPSAGMPARLSLTSDKHVLRNDGSDDAQLIISVQNKDGQWIDDDVPVALSIVSGPGLLPTGRSWKTHTANMGRQAIEFRSYEPGKTVLNVSSPHLEPASIEITTLGVATDSVTLR